MRAVFLGSTAMLCAVSASGAWAAGADPDQAASQTIIVTGQRQDDYRAQDTDALGIGLTVKETPATVSVLTDEFIRDTGARKLSDIITYIPGVVNNETAGLTADYFIVRGFGTTFTYLNGVRQAYYDQRRGLATIERVEVVKGPAGAESGVADFGGTVNILTKKPQPVFGARIDATIGDYNYGMITGDVTGPIALDGKLQARLIAGYQQDVSWRPGQRDRKPFLTIAPSLKLDYLPGGSITLEYEHNYSKDYYDRGVIYLRGFYQGGFGPRDSSSIHSELNYSEVKNDRVEVGLNQKLGSIFTLALHYQQARQDQFGRAMDAEPLSTDIGGGIYESDGLTYNGNGTRIPFFYSEGPNPSFSRTASGSLSADFTAAGVRNTILVGYDDLYNRQTSRYRNLSVSNFLDLAAPNNHQQPVFTGTNEQFNFKGVETIQSYYAKWVARFGDRFRTLASLRRDNYTVDYDDGGFVLGDKLTSYRIAASYDLTGTITGFVGYANGFQPANARTRAGPVPPVRGRNIEAGVKISLAGGKALWTNSLYSIRQDNLTIGDPTNGPLENFVILFGAVRVRGFESELTGAVLPGLKLGAGVTVLESKVVESTDGSLGKRFINTPNVQASAFGSYDMTGVGVKGVTARLGVTALGNRPGDGLETFFLPGYVRVDGGLGYAVSDRLTLDLRVENLFDKTYYTAADQGGIGGGTIGVGNRRLVQASIGYRF